MAIRTAHQPTVFTYLDDGIRQAEGVEPGRNAVEFVLPGTEEMTARIKIYVTGGENKMHSHPREDHSFFILGGKATFHLESDDNAIDLAANQAIMLPRGTRYWFTNTGDGNLVMLRTGSGKDASVRLDSEGREMPTSDHAGWRHIEGIPAV